MNVIRHQSEVLEAPGIAHGFFTRLSGVSKGIYKGLNCGPGSRDDKKDIRENRRRAAATLGFGSDHLCTLYQVHSTTVLTVNKPWVQAPLDADAMVCKTPGILIGILTADCAPVLFSDAEAGIVAAAHAGWKGAIGGVLENTIAVMCDQGAKRERIAAAIGPCIGQQSYEVGPEFVAHFHEVDEKSRAFFKGASRAGKSLFNLEGYVLDRLKRAGLQRIEASAMDTAADEKQFFSYRRATLAGEKDYGRQLSAIGLVMENV